jgi:hypothetical protein
MMRKINMIEPQDSPFSQTAVSDSDFDTFSGVVISFLQDKKCISIPKRLLNKTLKKLDIEKISFTFKIDKKSNWVVFHALYCHCR